MERDKKSILTLIAPVIFAVISVLLAFFFNDTLDFYDSVLDKYLNLNYITLLRAGSVINLVLAVVFALIFIIFLVKKDAGAKAKRNTLIITFILFIIANIIMGVFVVNFQANENEVVETIPNNITSYVEFDELFDTASDDDYYQEQTTFNKISTDIPVNYDVQQSNSDSSVKTACVQITDENLMNEYYKEIENRYSNNNPVEFSADELKSISADKGYYYTDGNYTLGIVVLKDDKIFDVYLSDENIELNDNILKQIEKL